MSLIPKQNRFARMIALLILFAQEKGYEVTCGDFFRDERCDYGHPKSLHKRRLAADLNLFKDGVYLKDTEDYRLLGEFWESLGGSWGGRINDGNHFSLSHDGMI